MVGPIVLVSQGWIHPNLFARRALRQALQDAGVDSLDIPNLERLPEVSLQDRRAVVLYIHHQSISPAALGALDDFVRRGGGLLAIHSAAASFKGEEAYTALLGGHFVSHGKVGDFRVEPVPGAPAIFGKIEPFTIRDERYLHEVDPSITVHFTSRDGDEAEPFAWTRRHGDGRVCYCAAGHTTASLRYPAVRRILLAGLEWCAEGAA